MRYVQRYIYFIQGPAASSKVKSGICVWESKGKEYTDDCSALSAC